MMSFICKATSTVITTTTTTTTVTSLTSTYKSSSIASSTLVTTPSPFPSKSKTFPTLISVIHRLFWAGEEEDGGR